MNPDIIEYPLANGQTIIITTENVYPWIMTYYLKGKEPLSEYRAKELMYNDEPFPSFPAHLDTASGIINT